MVRVVTCIVFGFVFVFFAAKEASAQVSSLTKLAAVDAPSRAGELGSDIQAAQGSIGKARAGTPTDPLLAKKLADIDSRIAELSAIAKQLRSAVANVAAEEAADAQRVAALRADISRASVRRAPRVPSTPRVYRWGEDSWNSLGSFNN